MLQMQMVFKSKTKPFKNLMLTLYASSQVYINNFSCLSVIFCCCNNDNIPIILLLKKSIVYAYFA